MDQQNPRSVKTTETTFRTIEQLESSDGAGVTELASELGLAKSTIHRHLSTLERMEYLVCEDDTYYLSMRFLHLGEYSRKRKSAYDLAKTKLNEIAEETQERAQFIVEEHGLAVYVHRASGDLGVEADSGIGKRVPLHATSAGKAILAHLPRERVEEIMDDRGLTAVTENTITDKETLFSELETIRERNVAYNNQENIEGLRAVGVPIKTPDGDVLGAFSVSGPTHRIKGELLEETIPDLLLGAANEVELNITYL